MKIMMKLTYVFVVGSIAVLGLTACGKTPQTPSAPEKPAVAEPAVAPSATTVGDAPKADAAIKMANNTICPITGSKAGSMVKDAHVDYGGYRVGLCCSDCVAKFMKDPEVNLKKALTPK